MAVASCSHISAYWVSRAAIAAVFWPKKLVAISDSTCARLAMIAGGGTVMANACSNPVAAAVIWVAVCLACAAVVVSHSTYGVTAAPILTDDGPSHCQPVRLAITER
ncbi:Uncharacterised protein [Mycobacterium tuberculosis]|uniref:Uncharacterized protein n=1 Tax=Mycobacterium tuberculosis TaxID=1773 RepID=A0A655AHT0_MYCTX|nr:Uncharacterised protein [Mycobacterium tuberculosis]CKR88984.1 Uncharacterised protein [Mycobacterium tuberculosis]CKT31447.1 Uncharacterised protein [Mycobacterium tuberculosis]CKT80790.1 Uncharacterised protein [Mycobacterium tuberculosis]CKU30200.1 Uncharacterised protein [Mycobacterium tuberculosis]